MYFPNIVPGMATIMMWSFFFRPGNTGVLNILLSKVGISPQVWLNNPKWTIPLIIITMTWKSAGSTSLIYMAGISRISSELYEAATIDGAGIWQRVRHIIVPSIFSLAKTLLILQIISVFQILYEPLVMTNGGPNNASISLMMLTYNYAFRDFNYPMGAALSVVICAILIVLSGIYTKLTKTKSRRGNDRCSLKAIQQKRWCYPEFDLHSFRVKLLIICIVVICAIIAFVCLFPTVWVFGQFKDIREFRREVTIFPSKFDFSVFVKRGTI